MYKIYTSTVYIMFYQDKDNMAQYCAMHGPKITEDNSTLEIKSTLFVLVSTST